MEEIVELNVGGTCFTTTRSTLCKEPSSMLARMFGGDMSPSAKDKQGRFFIDRSGEHFGSVLAYLRGQHVDITSSHAVFEEAKYYQLEGLVGELTTPLGHGFPGIVYSLGHCCELQRHSLGAHIIDAVESALVLFWMNGTQRTRIVNKPDCLNCSACLSRGSHLLSVLGHPNMQEDCSQCSGMLDLHNYKAVRRITLWLKNSEFAMPICSNGWQEEIVLCVSDDPSDQIKGADAANFMKVVYKCYGLIVKDLAEKGFLVTVKFLNSMEGLLHPNPEYRFMYDLAATIDICATQ